MKTLQAKSLYRSILLAALVAVTSPAQAQKVRVTEAVPNEAEQGVVNLYVEISGNGFDPSVEATFLVAGSDTDTGGVVVRGNSYKSNKKMVANIDIPEGAKIGDYDIEVRVSGGRRGKGNTLFRVLEKNGGNNDNPYDGESISLDCQLDDAAGNHVFSDGLGVYADGADNAGCSTGGVAQPNLSSVILSIDNSGKFKRYHDGARRIDLAFPPCSIDYDYDCDLLPAEIHVRTASVEDMEVLNLAVNPYAEQGDIQLLEPNSMHEMSVRILPKGYGARFNIQFLGRVLPDDFHQGIYCDLAQNPNFDPEDAIGDDVSVHVWSDNDGDGVPDGYTATTGSFVLDGSGTPTGITPGTRTASICSNVGPVACAGPSDGDLCNLLGQVEVQFTLYSINQ